MDRQTTGIFGWFVFYFQSVRLYNWFLLYRFLLLVFKKVSMTETEVAISGNSGGTSGDTEIDLYADVVENELETVWS